MSLHNGETMNMLLETSPGRTRTISNNEFGDIVAIPIASQGSDVLKITIFDEEPSTKNLRPIATMTQEISEFRSDVGNKRTFEVALTEAAIDALKQPAPYAMPSLGWGSSAQEDKKEENVDLPKLTLTLLNEFRDILPSPRATNASPRTEVPISHLRPGSVEPLLPDPHLVSFTCEDALKEKGVQFTAGEAMHPFVALDGNLVTGQNPASAKSTAKALLDILEGVLPTTRDDTPLPPGVSLRFADITIPAELALIKSAEAQAKGRGMVLACSVIIGTPRAYAFKELTRITFPLVHEHDVGKVLCLQDGAWCQLKSAQIHQNDPSKCHITVHELSTYAVLGFKPVPKGLGDTSRFDAGDKAAIEKARLKAAEAEEAATAASVLARAASHLAVTAKAESIRAAKDAKTKSHRCAKAFQFTSQRILPVAADPELAGGRSRAGRWILPDDPELAGEGSALSHLDDPRQVDGLKKLHSHRQASGPLLQAPSSSEKWNGIIAIDEDWDDIESAAPELDHVDSSPTPMVSMSERLPSPNSRLPSTDLREGMAQANEKLAEAISDHREDHLNSAFVFIKPHAVTEATKV